MLLLKYTQYENTDAVTEQVELLHTCKIQMHYMNCFMSSVQKKNPREDKINLKVS